MWWITTKAFGEIKEGTYTAAGYGGHMMTVVPELDTVIVLRFNTDDLEFDALMGELNSDPVIYTLLNEGRVND
jgi:CubicO group peptidase (beta-lactamase class C family)